MSSTTNPDNQLRNGGKPVIWVHCPQCDRDGYFGFNVHTPRYCTSILSTHFDYRSYRERRTITRPINEPSFSKYMSFFNFLKQ